MQREDQEHIPVLLRESVDGLNVHSGARVIDCTLGLGGHTRALLEQIGPTGKVLAFDRDPQMLERAKRNLGAYANQVTFVHANFADVGVIALEQGFKNVQGILADLGVASVHFNDAKRGFSFSHDGPLDMRFDPHGGRISASELINTFPEEELTQIFRTYGEERYARTIAKQISLKRKQKEIKTTGELAEIIVSCIHPSKQKLHPATKVFQALRIYINDELGALTRVLESIPDILVTGGRAAIISYHSLEDRLVKRAFNTKICVCPPLAPKCLCKQILTPVTKKPIVPSDKEITHNPRARSAKLRIAQKQ